MMPIHIIHMLGTIGLIGIGRSLERVGGGQYSLLSPGSQSGNLELDDLDRGGGDGSSVPGETR